MGEGGLLTAQDFNASKGLERGAVAADAVEGSVGQSCGFAQGLAVDKEQACGSSHGGGQAVLVQDGEAELGAAESLGQAVDPPADGVGAASAVSGQLSDRDAVGVAFFKQQPVLGGQGLGKPDDLLGGQAGLGPSTEVSGGGLRFV